MRKIAIARGLTFGTLEAPLMPLSSVGSHPVARGWAVTTGRPMEVVVKRLPPFQLVREVVCNLLADMVGLPVPGAYVLDTRGSDWDGGEHRYVFGTGYEGFSSLLRPARESPAALSSITRWPGFLAAIAFDEWVANEDRTLSNLLFAGQRSFLLIDHGEALPNHMNDDTKLRNRLARHLVASEPSTDRHDLSQRVKAACSDFGSADFAQLRAAAMLGSWNGDPQFSECLRLLQTRLNALPALIEEEFRLGQGQLLA